MIDTRHSTELTKTGDQAQRKAAAVPRRHFSFQGNDISSCDKVCVRSIIDQLEEKLDVGKPRVRRRMKHNSFQSGMIQITKTSKPKSRSKSMMISRFDHVMPLGLRDVVPHAQEPSHRSNEDFEASQVHSSNASLQPPQSPNYNVSSSSCNQFDGLSPGSLGSCRSRRGMSRRINHSDLPPAFRDSLDNSMLGSKTARKRKSLEGRPNHSFPGGSSSSVNRAKYHRSPSKLQRIWPPLPRKDRRPSHVELLESSLSDLRLMACVKSHIRSFEPPRLPIFSPENENQEKEEILLSSSSIQLLPKEGEAETQDGNINAVQQDTLALPGPESIPGLASALKSGKCKGSLRIRWSGPEVFFIEGRHRKSFEPLYYDDLLEDRFQSVSEHSTNKPLLVDRFGARFNDCCPGLPNRPRRYDDDDDWSDYEDEVDDGPGDGEHSPSDPLHPHGGGEVPMSPPMIWITRLDNDSLLWRVRRVWDDPKLDSLEKDRIIPDEDLLNTLKNLSGLPAIPTEQLLEEGNKVTETANGKTRLPWSIQKFYDIDGEIMDELCSLSEISVEEDVMLDAIVAFANETQVSSPSQQNLSTSSVRDHGQNNSQPVDVMVPSAPADTSPSQDPDSRSHLDESISVLETDDCPSIGDSRGEPLTPASKTRPKALSHIKVAEANSPSTSSTALDSITRESADIHVFASTGVEKSSQPVEPNETIEIKEKKKKKRRDHGTLASLLSPPPVLKFFDLPD